MTDMAGSDRKAQRMADTVTSPAGATVRLIPPRELSQLIGADDKRNNARTTMLKLDDKRRGIITHLWRHGPVEHPSGIATSVLADQLASVDSSRQLPAVLSSPVMAQCVARTTRGKRTFRIELVAIPREWWKHLRLDTAPAPAPIDLTDDTDTDIEPPTLTLAPPPDPALDPDIASAVAIALLAQVAEIITTGNGGTGALDALRATVTDVETRLGQQVAYTDKLRRQLRDAHDTNAALTVERDGLRSRLRAAERNLTAATSADTARIIDTEVARKLAAIMEAKPVGPGTHDTGDDRRAAGFHR
jgi:regulator of replication initiation timing